VAAAASEPTCMKFVRSVAFVVLMQLVSAGCRSKPPLKMITAEAGVVADAQTLSEYPTTVSHVRLMKAPNGPTVWEIRAKLRTPQIHKLAFVAGMNSVALARPDSGEYEVIIPKGKSSFILEKSTTYTIEMWGTSDQPAKADFRLEH